MSTDKSRQENQQPDLPESSEQEQQETGKRDDRTRYNLVRDSVEDLANEPMRDEDNDDKEV